jgi:ABC-type phosphate/phosphonate transport system substrate-binding protein
LRTLLIGALAATLVGCSRQPPPQSVTGSCTGTNGFACLERTAGPPIELATFRINSTATGTKSASTRKTEKSSSAHARHGARLASKAAKSTTIAAKAEPPASRVPLPPSSPKTQLQAAGNAVAAESKTTGANIAEPHPTVGPSNSDTRMIEAQVAAATALAERMTVATAAPDMKANNRDRSTRPETLARGNTEKPESASANDTDLMVAVLMARPDIKSVSDLTGKTIAIDDRHSASNRSVRTALVAAGAPEVQLSEGQATAINRLVNGEVPAAVLALVSADAAEGFPEIAGFKIFHIPLSPHSLKARP